MEEDLWVLESICYNPSDLDKSGRIWNGTCNIFGKRMSNGKEDTTINMGEFEYNPTTNKIRFNKFYNGDYTQYEKEWLAKDLAKQLVELKK